MFLLLKYKLLQTSIRQVCCYLKLECKFSQKKGVFSPYNFFMNNLKIYSFLKHSKQDKSITFVQNSPVKFQSV